MMLLLFSLFFMKNKTQKVISHILLKRNILFLTPLTLLYVFRFFFLNTPLHVKVVHSAFYLTLVHLSNNKKVKIFNKMGKILTQLKNVIKILYIITFTVHCVPLQVKIIHFFFSFFF